VLRFLFFIQGQLELTCLFMFTWYVWYSQYLRYLCVLMWLMTHMITYDAFDFMRSYPRLIFSTSGDHACNVMCEVLCNMNSSAQDMSGGPNSVVLNCETCWSSITCGAWFLSFKCIDLTTNSSDRCHEEWWVDYSSREMVIGLLPKQFCFHFSSCNKLVEDLYSWLIILK